MPGEPDPVGDGGQAGQHREGVRASHHVEIVDLAALLTKPESLGEKEEVELGPLGRLGQFHEGRERDVAPGIGITPHRGVVHAGEVGGQMDLPGSVGHRADPHSVRCLRVRASRRCVAVGGPGSPRRARSVASS